MASARLEELRASRAAAEAKLNAIIATDPGFDGSGQGVTVTPATERYKSLIEFYDKQIAVEIARTPWQRRVQVRAN